MAQPATKGTSVQLSALIVAAGEARRFGQPKQLLPWGRNNTILGSVLATVKKTPGLARIHVVLGAHYDAITKTMESALSTVNVIRNRAWQQGMFSSITEGLRFLSNDATNEGILVLLGDMPFITPEILSQFVGAAETLTQEQPLIIATVHDRPAHPYLLWQHHIGEILSLSGETGIRPFIQKHFAQAHAINVSRHSGRQDIDTWETYKQLFKESLA